MIWQDARESEETRLEQTRRIVIVQSLIVKCKAPIFYLKPENLHIPALPPLQFSDDVVAQPDLPVPVLTCV